MSIEQENFDNIQKNETELDQYGVWVKKTPEKMDEAGEDFFLDDLDFANESAVSPETVNEELSDATLDAILDEPLETNESETIQDSAESSNAEIEDTFIPEDIIPEAENVVDDTSAEDMQDIPPIPTDEEIEKMLKESSSMDDMEEVNTEALEQPQEESVNKNEAETENKEKMETSASSKSGIDGIEEVDLEDFLDPVSEEDSAITDEKPLNIDLSFGENAEEAVPEELPVEVLDTQDDAEPIEELEDIPEAEEIGQSEIQEKSDNSEEFSTTSGTGIEEIDLEDIGIETEKTPEEVSQPDEAPMENIDIDSFNTYSYAPEETEEVNASEQVQETVAEEQPLQEKSEGEAVYDIAVRADDDDPSQHGSTTPEATIGTMSSSLLEKIAGELSMLRKDITDLKGDLNSLKTSPADSKTAELSLPTMGKSLIEQAGEQTNENLQHVQDETSGFFSSDETDDTIALSNDELNNILTSADFTAEENSESTENTETVEDFAAQDSAAEKTAYADEQTLDESTSAIETELPDMENIDTSNFQEQELEEPQLEDINFDIDEEVTENVSEQLPDEIDIPVMDDLVVGSSDVDFLEETDSPKELDENTIQFLAENPDERQDKNDSEIEDADITLTNEIAEPATEEIAEIEMPAEDLSADETFAEELPAEELGAEIEENDAVSEEENGGEDENDEEEMSQYSPIHDVFDSNQWQEEDEVFDEIENDLSKTEDETNMETVDTTVPQSTVLSAEDKAIGAEEKDDEKNIIPENMREDIKSVLLYMDQLLENLPEDKILEFAKSEHFTVYKKLFTELGLS